jgi:hypothetical protein
MKTEEIKNSINHFILALDEISQRVSLADEPKKMQNIVIEYCVRGKDGTKYPSVGFTQDYYYDIYDWNNMHEGVADEIPNTLFQEQGYHGKDEIPVTYYNALIRTEKSIEYWIKVLDAVSWEL